MQNRIGLTGGTRLACILSFLTFLVPILAAQTGSSTMVISQVYGGGGNQGATLTNDFIELLNRSASPVDVTGWTVQYASASGSNWQRTDLSGMIQPGQYYLVQEKQGNGGSVPLPAPDAVGGLGLSATSGKVALVSDSAALSGSSPSSSHIVDLVGYGNANFAEGTPAGGLSNTTAAIRKSGGCTDTDDNGADFDVSAPDPRNGQSPLNPCSVPVPQAPEISQAGVTNAASFLAGSVAPGEIITIFGSGLGPDSLATLQLTADGRFVTTSLAGTRVLFDGVPAPMIYTLEGQVSAVVPYSVAGRSNTRMQVEYAGRASNTITLQVSSSAPGVFSLDSSGRGQGAILNQDYSVNGPSNPAAKGSVVIIFATGAGQTKLPGVDGEVIGGDLPLPVLPVSVRIGGVKAEALYAGGAPGMVSGVLQLNVKVPEDLAAGGSVSIELTVGEATSQPGVSLSVAGGSQWTGDPAIEEKLARLKSDPSVAALPEIPHDRIAIPADWLGLVSWNIQVGGTSTSATATRPPMVQAALSAMFSGSFGILAAQEIPNSGSDEFLRTLLPGGSLLWNSSFFDTTDSMDNGFWYQNGITMRDAFPLLVTDATANGKIPADSSRALHPPQVAQFEVGNFDFTLLTVHLTFASGDTAESVRELRNILDYLDWYFNQPDHDPDVIVCGDFNIPSTLSGQTGRDGVTLDTVFDQDSRFQSGERRFVVTVHEATSRSSAAHGGTPANNYDHCVCSVDTLEEFVQARRVATDILTDHPQDPEVRLTSDHFPIVAFFRTSGDGVALDLKSRIRPSALPGMDSEK